MHNAWFASLIARLRTPRYRWLRIPLGLALVIAGLFGFLPVLGFWMAPLGLSLLALDFPWAGKLLRRLQALLRLLLLRVRKWRQRLSTPNDGPEKRN